MPGEFSLLGKFTEIPGRSFPFHTYPHLPHRLRGIYKNYIPAEKYSGEQETMPGKLSERGDLYAGGNEFGWRPLWRGFP